ncbi:hypothetical protein HYS84_02730 [Candidatus Saccharibacteria bacterium]|nr:hypothetical protein [Candidatus Saccharibacteria bacterium]
MAYKLAILIDEPAVGLSYIEIEGGQPKMPNLKRLLVVGFAVVTVGLIFSTPATAHRVRITAETPLLKRLELQKHVLKHTSQTQFWFARRSFRLLQLRRPPLGTAAYALWWHIKQERWLRREIGETNKLIRTNLMGDIPAWSCIHRYEATWHYDKDAPGHNGTYDGGLQMDLEFQSTYGPPALGFKSWSALHAAKGTADRWTPREQIIVAEYARRNGRGYYPWPNTARYCGLI